MVETNPKKRVFRVDDTQENEAVRADVERAIGNTEDTQEFPKWEGQLDTEQEASNQ